MENVFNVHDTSYFVGCFNRHRTAPYFQKLTNQTDKVMK